MRQYPWRCVPVFACLLCVLAVEAAAQSREHIIIARNWGLLGVWQLDCKKTASRNNIHIEYVARDGQLYYDRRYESIHDSAKVVDLLVNRDGSLQITVRFDKQNETFQWVSIHQGTTGLRTIQSRNISTGEFTIRDGKVVSSGRPAPLQSHCR